MNRPLRLACLALLALSNAAAAAEWPSLGDNTAMRLSLNPAGTKAKDGTNVSQYRIDFKSPQKNADGKTYQSSTMTVNVSCSAKTVALMEYQVHAAPGGQGALVSTQKVATQVANKVAPGSSDELVLNGVCAPKPAAAPAPAPATTPAAKPAAPKK